MNCPKCRGEMTSGILSHACWISDEKNAIFESFKQSNWIIPGFACKNCGYIEFYAPR